MSNSQVIWNYRHSDISKGWPVVDTNIVYIQQKSTMPYVYITSEAVIRYCESVMSQGKKSLIQRGLLTALDGRKKDGVEPTQFELIKTFAKMIGCELKYFPAKEFEISDNIRNFKPYLEDLKKLKSSE